jgi:anthranilate synthase component 1
MHIKLTGEPDLLKLHELNPDRYPYLLESVAHGTDHSRYSILFAFPSEALLLDANFNTRLDGKAQPSGFLDALQLCINSEKKTNIEDSFLPFYGGWFVYLSYEIATEIEPGLKLPRPDKKLPVAFASRCPAAIIVDHQQQCSYIVVEQEHEGLLETMQMDIEHLNTVRQHDATEFIYIESLIEENAPVYQQAVEKIKNYIIDGDVFQVNLSRLWQTKLTSSTAPSALYRRLRHSNPAPFACLCRFENLAIISSSPERLVCSKKGIVETRPIAGTRPRSSNLDEDLEFSEELLSHHKELAEHIMLIDLERNDLGRVCKPGTIEVDELMSLESFTHVHHIVSNVRGELREDMTAVDVIKAVFPGGTITGCPKVRCMEIIAELEQQPRGAYTGSLGYINLDGSMDLNILIRTLIQQDEHINFRAGAGIVYDSDPERELEETRAKALGMVQALQTEPEQC